MDRRGSSEEREAMLSSSRSLASINRFQVSKTDGETDGGDVTSNNQQNGVWAGPLADSAALASTSSAVFSDRSRVACSEPPPELRPPINTRKMSATGRFMVMTDDSVSTKLLEDYEGKEEKEAPNTIAKTRGVHFSMSEEEVEDLKKRENSQDTYATLNMKSWRNMKTIEHPPIMDFYRNSVDIENVAMRPSMAQLINGKGAEPEVEQFEGLHIEDHMSSERPEETKKTTLETFKPPPQQQTRKKFGWVEGVFMRCMLNIFGVMLYLRISWVAGQAGVGLGTAVVLLASVVTTITAISTCAICTNGDVKGGGAYFLISRTLGPEFGGSIGIIFSVANAVGAAMYIVGFAETVRDILRDQEIVFLDEGIWSVRVIGFVTCILLMAIVFIGTEFESKMQVGLLVILLGSIINYFVGSFFAPIEKYVNRGATGYSVTTLMNNFFPDFRGEENFFSVFAVYFPAATGIMAGANISGDLSDPQQAIPLGTLLAIAVTTVIYVATVWMTGASYVRYSDGESAPIFNGSTFIPPSCAVNSTCKYGLINHFQILEAMSFWGPLIIAGIFAATLSSALASLVSAPKVFQAVCKDRLFPKIGYFAKTYGKNEEPKRAYVLGFLVAITMVAIGDLNAIAPIISNFFLCSYALINYACFDQSFAHSPGFRPAFKYYNMWVSLIGAVLCISVMFVISWSTALITFFCFAAIFMYILHKKPDVNWGSSTQAHSYKNALASMAKLSNTEEHVKNYRPQFLILSGNPVTRGSMVDFANNITKGTSLMILGNVVPYELSDRVLPMIRKVDRQINDWLHKRKVKCFYSSVANKSLRAGSQALLQLTGLSKLKPNIMMVGLKCNWYKAGATEENMREINEYFGTIQDAFDCNMGVCIMRNGHLGLDFSEQMKALKVVQKLDEEKPKVSTVVNMVNEEEKSNLDSSVSNDKLDDNSPPSQRGSSRSVETFSKYQHHYIAASNSLADAYNDDVDDDSALNEGEEDVEEKIATDLEKNTSVLTEEDVTTKRFSLKRRRMFRKSKTDQANDNSRRQTMEQRALNQTICRFQRKVKKGTIDVWWLYDDGGLTLLIPHLLTIPKSYLEGARLRIFTISTSTYTMEQEQRSMVALLSKFRIDFSDVHVIADIGKKPQKETMDEWKKLIEPFTAKDGECPQGMTTESEISSQKEKTYRQLRAGELLQEHSSEADLIVMTLPVPRKNLISATLYLSWVDIMSRNLPPVLFVRGNQQSVLTFYS